MKLLELFCGTKSITKEFKKAGHECFTVDIEESMSPDLCIDILDLTPEMIISKFGHPDIIWASPPCTKFSVAAIGRNWIVGTNLPKNEETETAIKIVKHTLWLIDQLTPIYYFLENPRGKLRKLDFMQFYPRHTVTYCQYGDDRMKPTDIWTNHPFTDFKPICKNGDSCHVAAPRGSRTGTQGLSGAMERGIIPPLLCQHICKICEERIGVDIRKMSNEQIDREIELLKSEFHSDEWKNEFTRQEIKELERIRGIDEQY